MTSAACSRSLNFCSLPVAVRTIGSKMTCLGVLKPGSFVRQKLIMSSCVGVSVWSGRSSTTAHGTSPHLSSGTATTATPCTAGCVMSTSSTSIEETFSPPEMMMSFERSVVPDVDDVDLHPRELHRRARDIRELLVHH